MLSEFPASLRLASVVATCVVAFALATPALADGHGDGRKHRMDGDREARERMMQMERDRRRQAGARGQRDDDALAEYLFSPDQIMRHREALNVSDGQGKKLVALMSGFQAGVVETQWKLSEAKTAMKQQLEADRISEKGIRAAPG